MVRIHPGAPFSLVDFHYSENVRFMPAIARVSARTDSENSLLTGKYQGILIFSLWGKAAVRCHLT